MKKLMFYCILVLAGSLLLSCAKEEAKVSANWDAWKITWYENTTKTDSLDVNFGNKQKTFFPEQENSVFLFVSAYMENISQETQELRFPPQVFTLTDKDGKSYELVGIAGNQAFLMAAPYRLDNKGDFTTTKWETGFFTIAYPPQEGIWFIQATPGEPSFVSFIFTVPKDITEFSFHGADGTEMRVFELPILTAPPTIELPIMTETPVIK